MNLPKAFLFDLDGVLLDTEDLHSEAWTRAAASCGTKLNKKQLMFLKGRRRMECAELVTEWVKKTISVKDFLKLHQPISRELMGNARAMSGAENLIKWCSDNKLPMALVTSSTSSSVDVKSDSHGWLKLIQTRVNGDDVALMKGKPNPDPFLLAANKLGVDPKLCWALEDSVAGTNAALAAGCKVWVINKELNKSEKSNQTMNPTHIRYLDEVLEELQNLSKINS